MRIKSLSLGLSAGLITAIGFGICGVFFAIAPGPTSAFLSWVLHLDVTGMTRPLSVSNLLAGIVLFGAYVGLAVGEPRLLVIGSYRMGFATTPGQTDVTLSVGIDYDLPRRGLSQILGRLFGRSYAKWCTKRLAQDAQSVLGRPTPVPD